MRYIFCKKCGAKIDADLGVCPVCGTVYYVLNDVEDSADKTVGPAEPVSNDQDETLDHTRVFSVPVPPDGEQPRKTPNLQDTQRISPEQIHAAASKGRGQGEGKFKMDEEFQRTSGIPITRMKANGEPVDGNPAPRRPGNGQRPPQQGGHQQRPTQQGQQRRSAQESSRGESSRGARPDRIEEYPQKKKKKKSKISKGFLMGALVLLAFLTVVICVLAGAFDFSGTSSSGDVMPNVLGKTLSEVEEELEALGLTVNPVQEASEEEAGTIIRQSIPEGQKLRGSETVTLTISSGKSDESEEKVKVPDLSNLTYEAAKEKLAEYGLVISKSSEVYDDNIGEGRVVSQSPDYDEEVSKGTTIYVTLSKGVESTPTPTYTITVTAGHGGSVSPKGQVQVEDGASATFSIVPDAGYEIREVKVDGQDVGAVSEYTFSNVTGNHTLYVVFQSKPTVTDPPEAETPEPDPSTSQPPVNE
jgi:beta-lactam-binding protein with PASTA domain